MSTGTPESTAGYQWNTSPVSTVGSEIALLDAKMAALESERLRIIYEGGGEALWGRAFDKQLEQLRDEGFALKRLAIVGTGGGAHLQKAALRIFPEIEIDVYELNEEKCRQAQEALQREFPEAAHRVHHIVGDVREKMPERVKKKEEEEGEGAGLYDGFDLGLTAQHLPDVMLQGVLSVGVSSLRSGGRLLLRDVTAENWQVTPHDEPFGTTNSEEYLRRQRASWTNEDALRLAQERGAYIPDVIQVAYTSKGAELSPSPEALANRMMRLSIGLQLLPEYSSIRLATIRPQSVEQTLIVSIMDINELVLRKKILLALQQPPSEQRDSKIIELNDTLKRLHDEGEVYKEGISDPATTYYYPALVSQMYEKK